MFQFFVFRFFLVTLILLTVVLKVTDSPHLSGMASYNWLFFSKLPYFTNRRVWSNMFVQSVESVMLRISYIILK